MLNHLTNPNTLFTLFIVTVRLFNLLLKYVELSLKAVSEIKLEFISIAELLEVQSKCCSFNLLKGFGINFMFIV